INATGIILHTNLGRAPIAEEAARAAYAAARGYLNLELDLDSGKRSTRQSAIRDWVCRLTGAESATALNTNAPATVLVLRALCDFNRFGFRDEPAARESIAQGADLALFSGDKLLGGPQAGIIAGRQEFIQKIEKDPLMRAFRLDKMTLAALEATLRLCLNEERALQEVPVLRLLSTAAEQLRPRAEALAEPLRQVPGVSVRVAEDVAYVGGGSL